MLFMYGVVPTFQKTHFHRTYAAYGGIFIVMALCWGYLFEDFVPDIYDITGTIVAAIGVIVIFYYPRKEDEKIGIGTSD